MYAFSMFLPLPERPVKPARRIHHSLGIDQSSIEIRSTQSGITEFHSFMDKLQHEWSIPDPLFARLLIAVSEAVLNAVYHGNKLSADKYVTVTFERTEELISATVEDEGDGFAHRRYGTPLEDFELLKPSGRGIFIMRHQSDFVYYSNRGSKVKLLFYK